MAGDILEKTNGAIKKTRSNKYKGKPAIATLTNGYCIVDHKWTVKYWNKAAEELLGVPESEIVGKNLWNHFAPLLPVEFYSVYYKVFLTDVPVHFQEYWSEMGAWFDVTTWYLDNDLFISFKSSNRPNSEAQANPEERLRTLTELYRYVTEITNDCLWEWDLKEKEIFWIDGGHKRTFGYQIENKLVPEYFWKSCIHPDDRDRVLSRLGKIISGKKETIWEDEYRFKKQDGDFLYVNDRAHLIFDENDEVNRIIGATQDINHRVLMVKETALQIRNQAQQLTSAAIAAQEIERSNIGKELHDNLGQKLSVAKMYLQLGKKSFNKRSSSITKSLALVSEVINDIRKISKVLVVPPTNIIGVFDNISNLLKDLSAVQGIKIKFHEPGIVEKDISDDQQLAIFRIVQEHLNNILRHSKATIATISIKSKGGDLVMAISDNGKGCNLSKHNTGVGILNIRSRAAVLGGEISIRSRPGKGYKLKVKLPISPLH
jgi:PAS domain S-box-containing protein